MSCYRWFPLPKPTQAGPEALQLLCEALEELQTLLVESIHVEADSVDAATDGSEGPAGGEGPGLEGGASKLQGLCRGQVGQAKGC